ncbi:MAG: AEC family transporter [Aestuariivirgaceae bacterium]
MNIIAITVIPVFALIALGYAAARFKLFSAEAERGLNRFVLYFAIPALLFRTMVAVDVASPPWRLWGAFFTAGAVIWWLGIAASRYLASIRPSGGAAAAITSSFGNLLLMGIPLSVSFFGPAAALPAGLILSIHSPIQWAAATLRAELSEQKADASFSSIVIGLVNDLIRNPIVMAILAGSLWRATGLGLNTVVDRTIDLLGQAGIPTSLFALGLSLVAFGFKGNIRGVTVMLVLKLMLFPLLAAALVTTVFKLPPVEAGVVVLFASLPPGVNAYLFASKYDAAVAPVSGAIAIGTALSLFTTSAVLWFLSPA